MSLLAPAIELNFYLSYGKSSPPALDLKVQIPGRGVTAIYGPSGAGKTSLLRCIAGLQQAKGELSVLGQSWQSQRHSLPTHKRPLGFVFQEASLFAHLTAAGNLRFAQKRAAAQSSTWSDIVALMGLEALLERYPHQLSGGERQRVAIARALLIQPKLLLMDEPLAALDASLKSEIMPYLERLHERAEVPILYVSHSLDEIARFADHVVILQQGRVQLQG
ncbi:MAG: molybdenum ABC transporter ATP-binding protein, partial [Oceanococcus sp.]